MKTLILPAILVAGCASSANDNIMRMLAFESPRSELSAREQARVDRQPLGSAENPVRAMGPAGQREYLSRMRCPEGGAPIFERVGSAGQSPYGSILDLYEVVCDTPPPRQVFIDMYHAGYVETRPVPGFTLAPLSPSAPAARSPPR